MSVRALKAGAFDFIQKPFNYQVMIDTIQAAVTEGVRALHRGAERRPAHRAPALPSPRASARCWTS